MKRNDSFKNITISRSAVLEDKYGTINIGEGSEIEDGVILSTKHGGSITVGKNCIIRRGAMLLTYGGNIALGDYCGVNIYSILYGHGGLVIGDYVQIAAHSVVIPANHGFSSLDIPIWKQPLSKKGIQIENDVWVGANVTILDGVKIGRGAVIGAGSVVTKSIMSFAVVTGNPAEVIKIRTDNR